MHDTSRLTAPRPKSKKPSHFDRLWDFCRDFSLFSTPNGHTFAQPSDEHCNGLVFPIHHPRFRQFLLHKYVRAHDSIPSKAALNAAVALAHDRAVNCIHRDAAPGIRIVAQPGSPSVAIHGNHYGEAWEINSQSVSIAPGFLFYQGRGELPLARPHPDLSPTALADFPRLLRLASDTDWLRCLIWLLAAYRPHGPYPILILQGPAQSGKSHAARLLRACVDPNRAPLHPLPSSPKKLRELAYENWVLAFDHLTRFPSRLAESLARLTENEILYLPPKDDQTALSLARPIILTVAESCYSRPKSPLAPSSPGSSPSPIPPAKLKTNSMPPPATFCPSSSRTSFAPSKPPSKIARLSISPPCPACPMPSSGPPLPRVLSKPLPKPSTKPSSNRPTHW